MLLEFLSHAMAFDLNWIAALVLNNLHWVFALFAYVVIAHKGHKSLWLFLTMVALLWAASDIAGLGGWVLVSLLFFVPLNFMITIFTDNTSLQKHFLKIIVLLFFLLSFIGTFFIPVLGG